MENPEKSELIFSELYKLRDDNNRRFVRAWRRLHELDPGAFADYQRAISENDEKITRLMRLLCE